jgi:RNA polymerase sigma-70 factor, ECF subfamily
LASWGFALAFEPKAGLIFAELGHLVADPLWSPLVASFRRPLQLVPPPRPVSEPPVPAFDDHSLLASLQERDPSACAAFYVRVRPVIDRVLCKLLGRDDADYEDVAQVALFEIVLHSHRFRGECPLDAWLGIVTARSAYRQLRRRRLERRFFGKTPSTEASLSLTVAPAAFASREALGIVRDHLLQMEEGRALTFLLHDVQGYSLQEISHILRISVAAAQSRLVRGRRELHERIQRDPGLASFKHYFSEESR